MALERLLGSMTPDRVLLRPSPSRGGTPGRKPPPGSFSVGGASNRPEPQRQRQPRQSKRAKRPLTRPSNQPAQGRRPPAINRLPLPTG